MLALRLPKGWDILHHNIRIKYGTSHRIPAVAERPRDALHLSMVSFNSTIYQVQLLTLQIYQCVQLNSVLFPSAQVSKRV